MAQPGQQFSLGRLDRKRLHDLFDQIIDSGQFTEGRVVRQLEDVVSEWTGLHAIAVGSAGAGLFAVLRCLAQASLRVHTCANTFFATGAMALEAGHEVKLLDCSRQDFSLGYDNLRIGADVVMLTHVGGGVAQDYRKIAEWCDQHRAFLLEDAAHALGVPAPQYTLPGRLGTAAVYSLYPTKAIPAGEGGVVVTRHSDLAAALRLFRNYGKFQSCGTMKYAQGMNLRMDEWTAAVALLQFERRNEIVARRNDDAEKLSHLFPSMLRWSSGTNWYKYITPAMYAVEAGVKKQSGKVYALTDQLQYALGSYEKVCKLEPLPNCEWVAKNHMCLPIGEGMYDGMTNDEIASYLAGE